MKILLDSGVTNNHNIGDIAILDTTIHKLKNHQIKWISADKKNILKDVLKCQVYIFCAGGLLKNTETQFIARKFVAVLIAKLTRKQIYIDTQTIFLKGIWRILFKILFKNSTIRCRDPISLYEAKALGLKSIFKPDPLIKPNPQTLFPYIAIDTRYKRYGNKVVKNVKALIKQLIAKGLIPKEIPTMHTQKNWRALAQQFSQAQISICASYHALIFSLNGKHEAIFITNIYWQEYYQRKLSHIPRTKIKKRRGFLSVT